MLKRRIIIGLISIFLILICYAVIPKIVFGNPDNVTLYSIADAHVVENNPDTNFGIDDFVYVVTRIDYDGYSFLKFDLSSLPDGAVISLATLRVYAWLVRNYIIDVSDIQARRVADDSWIETGDGSITWNNKKAYGVVEDTVVPAVGWVEWNVTSFVQVEWAGDETVSICLKSIVDSYNGVGRDSLYRSKEYDGGSVKPELYIEYTVSEDDEPFYSNAGYDEKTQVGLNADFWVFWEDDFALDTCYFSTNNSGSWYNHTLTVSGVSSWANKTLQLNYTSSVRVNYQWFCMDNASQWNNTSVYFLTTTPLYVTFNFNNSTMGKFKVDGVNTANETQNSYDFNQSIILDGIPLSSDYSFLNFTWSGGNSIINNYYYNTSGNNTVWCYFGIAEIGGIHENYFVLGFVIAGCSILFMVIVLKSDKKEK